MTYLLEGLKVIDLASFLAAPGAATLMADYGADVIKIEPPMGDGYRRLHGRYRTDYNWQLTSRHKQAMAMDIQSDAGHEVLMRLLEDADVLVTNFRNDQLEKYKLDYERLHARFPRLILAQLTGYGNVGPDRKRRGYDSSAWFARTGIMQLMKPRDAAPTFPAGGVGDHSTAMSLFAGIMMALYKREREGEGSFVETSLIGNGVWANGMGVQGAIAGFDLGELLQHSDRSPFARVYQTRDERYVILVLTHPGKEWRELAAALGHPEWLDDPRFADMRLLMKNRDAVVELLSAALGSMTLSEACQAMDEYHLTYGVVEGLTEVAEDAHLIENEVIVKTTSEDPDFEWTVASPIKLSDQSSRPISDPPAFGEHTRLILARHGYSREEIDELLAQEVVRVTPKQY